MRDVREMRRRVLWNVTNKLDGGVEGSGNHQLHEVRGVGVRGW